MGEPFMQSLLHLFVCGFDDAGECALPQQHALLVSVHLLLPLRGGVYWLVLPGGKLSSETSQNFPCWACRPLKSPGTPAQKLALRGWVERVLCEELSRREKNDQQVAAFMLSVCARDCKRNL